MPQRSPDAPGFPSDDAFVVWLDEARPGEPRRGSVEHVRTAARLPFEDLSELPALMRTLCQRPDRAG